MACWRPTPLPTTPRVVTTRVSSPSSLSPPSPRPTFGPVRLDLHRLLGVRQRGVELLQRSLSGGAVAVEDVVGGIDSDRGGEVLDGFGVVARAERGVSLGLRVVTVRRRRRSVRRR